MSRVITCISIMTFLLVIYCVVKQSPDHESLWSCLPGHVMPKFRLIEPERIRAQDSDAVASALFKLASGLTGKSIEFNLDDFLAQVDDMQVVDAEPGQGAPKEDWFATHPYSPLRVKALQLFENSVLSTNAKAPTDELEVEVQGLHAVCWSQTIWKVKRTQQRRCGALYLPVRLR